jgi:hypothetical protein
MTVKTAPPSSSAPWIISGVLAFVAVVTASVATQQYQRSRRLAAALATANAQIEQLRVQRLYNFQPPVAQTAAPLPPAVKPDMPVTVSFQRDAQNTGMVAVIRNLWSSPLEVAAVLVNPSNGQQQQRNLVLGPNGVHEIGRRQGWPFEPGQRITLSSENFKAKEVTVPGG